MNALSSPNSTQKVRKSKCVIDGNKLLFINRYTCFAHV